MPIRYESFGTWVDFSEVEVVGDLIGNSAMVVPLGADLATPRRVDARQRETREKTPWNRDKKKSLGGSTRILGWFQHNLPRLYDWNGLDLNNFYLFEDCNTL